MTVVADAEVYALAAVPQKIPAPVPAWLVIRAIKALVVGLPLIHVPTLLEALAQLLQLRVMLV
jgi:hypothetical protein